MYKWTKKNALPALLLFVTIFLTACGGRTIKTQEAMDLIATMDYHGALALLAEAETEKENAVLISRGKGIAYMGLAEYDQAVECFLQALSNSNGLIEDVDYDLNYYLAAAYGKSGNFEDAKKVYDSILALRPKEKDAYFLRGNAELELGQYTQAKEDYDKTVSMDPKNFDRLFAIYEAFAHFGYKEAGQEYLRTALETGEKKLSSFDKGRIYYYMEDYQKAYVELEDAKSDDKPQSSLYLGKAYEATGDYNYACNVYRSYLDKHKDSAEMYNQLGICEMKKGNYEDALAAFQMGKAVEDPSMMQVLSYNEIVAMEYMGNFDQATKMMQSYAKSYPGDADANREQVFLSTRQHSE